MYIKLNIIKIKNLETS